MTEIKKVNSGGVFVFLATLFSGLVLDAMEAGKVNVPLLSDLLNSTAF